MNLKEYIDVLQKLKEEHGDDIRVVENDPHVALYAIRDAKLPIVDTLQVKTNRERYEKVYRDNSLGVKKENSGVKVIVL